MVLIRDLANMMEDQRCNGLLLLLLFCPRSVRGLALEYENVFLGTLEL